MVQYLPIYSRILRHYGNKKCWNQFHNKIAPITILLQVLESLICSISSQKQPLLHQCGDLNGLGFKLAFQKEIMSLSPEKRCATVNVEILRGHRAQGKKFMFVALPRNEWVDTNTWGISKYKQCTYTKALHWNTHLALSQLWGEFLILQHTPSNLSP